MPMKDSAVIDCDIHNVVPSFETLRPYMPVHWQELATQSDFKGPVSSTMYTSGGPVLAEVDVKPPSGGPPGSELGLVQAQVLEHYKLDYGILNCGYAIESMRNPYGAAAFASAVNDWQVAEWLEKEPRLRASLVVPSQDPALAAKEIARMGDHDGFVQVFLPVRSVTPYGNRMYHPLFRAAVEHDLVIGIHMGGEPGAPPSSSGWPSFYVEEYAGMSHIFQSHIISMIVEGLFAEFPTLRVALIASGVSWLPSLMWRLDKEWKGLRREVPWVKQLPSDYMREHLRLTINPFDAPPDAEQTAQIFNQLGSDELVMFSTDYPYQHFDSVDAALPAGMPAHLQANVLSENAKDFYRL